jgi:hypothetical protein
VDTMRFAEGHAKSPDALGQFTTTGEAAKED